MSPALNGSSAIRHFEGSNVIEICDGITFDFYTGLPHVTILHFTCAGERVCMNELPWSMSLGLF